MMRKRGSSDVDWSEKPSLSVIQDVFMGLCNNGSNEKEDHNHTDNSSNSASN